MSYDIRNQEFRDMTAQARHPFQAVATMTNGKVTLPDDFLLDAIIYLPEGLMPFFLSTLEYDYVSGVLRVGISDADNIERSSALLIADWEDHTNLRDAHGIVVGTLTHEANVSERIAPLLQGAKVTFSVEQTPFQAGVCFTTGSATGAHVFRINGVDYTSDPSLLAQTGVQIVQDLDGANQIHLFGEEDFRSYVKSINGIAPTDYHMWLLPRHAIGHVQQNAANVRTSNDRGTLRIARASDFGYGDKVYGD